MTFHDIERLTPVVEDLQRRGVVSAYATTSWPDHKRIERDGYHGEASYTHGFLLSAPGLTGRLTLVDPFTEDDVVNRLGYVIAFQNHHAAVHSCVLQAGDQLLRDLGSVYAGRLLGKPLPIPRRIVIKDVEVLLPVESAPEGAAAASAQPNPHSSSIA